jgi:hypothetical protein
LKTFESYQFENPSGRQDDVKHGLPARNELGVDAGVERGETPPRVSRQAPDESGR